MARGDLRQGSVTGSKNRNAPMPTESMCARHPAVRSVTTCKCCGRFSCAQCLPNLDELCTDCVARVSAELPPLENRALLEALAVGATSAFHGRMASLGGAMVATNDTREDSALAMANGLASLGYVHHQRGAGVQVVPPCDSARAGAGRVTRGGGPGDRHGELVHSPRQPRAAVQRDAPDVEPRRSELSHRVDVKGLLGVGEHHLQRVGAP